jgi:hypothetical protein
MEDYHFLEADLGACVLDNNPARITRVLSENAALLSGWLRTLGPLGLFEAAAHHGRVECLQAFLDAGLCKMGFALREAVVQEHLPVVRLLAPYTNAVGKESALLYAAQHGHVEAFKLCWPGVLADVRDSVLIAAAENGQQDIMQWASSRQSFSRGVWLQAATKAITRHHPEVLIRVLPHLSPAQWVGILQDRDYLWPRVDALMDCVPEKHQVALAKVVDMSVMPELAARERHRTERRLLRAELASGSRRNSPATKAPRL